MHNFIKNFENRRLNISKLYNNAKQNSNQRVAYFATYLKSLEINFETLSQNIFKNNFFNKLRSKLYNYVIMNNTSTTREICETKTITNERILNKRKNFNTTNSSQRDSKTYKRQRFFDNSSNRRDQYQNTRVNKQDDRNNQNRENRNRFINREKRRDNYRSSNRDNRRKNE